MKIKNEDISVEELVKDLNPRANMIKDCGNGIYLSDPQIEILKQYGFSYQKYPNAKSLIFDIEEYLNENYEEDLENVVESLSEFNYYHNTNK